MLGEAYILYIEKIYSDKSTERSNGLAGTVLLKPLQTVTLLIRA